MNFDSIMERLRWVWLAHRRWVPLLSGVMMFTARFFPTRSLRVLVSALGLFFLLLVVVDVALDFLDKSYPNRPNSRAKTEVSLPELFFAAMLAFIYSALIIAGMNLLFLPSPIVVFLVMPAIFVVCCVVAWHNVTLWYEEGAEYEESLREANTKQVKTISSVI